MERNMPFSGTRSSRNEPSNDKLLEKVGGGVGGRLPQHALIRLPRIGGWEGVSWADVT